MNDLKRAWVESVCVAFLLISLNTPLLQQFTRALPDTELAGVKKTQLTIFPTLSMQTLWDGSFQKALEKWHGENFGLRNHMVKTYNQLYFWAFKTSPDQMFLERGKTIVGESGELMSLKHALNYLQFTKPVDAEIMDANAVRLARIQKLLGDRNIVFITLISPTKPSLYPEHIPAYLRVKNAYKQNSNYLTLKDALIRHGVNLVDGQDILTRQKEKAAPPLFSKGGFHWNRLGQYYPAMEILERIEKAGKPVPRKPAMVDIEFAKPQIQVETELVSMLNLWFFDMTYPCPRPVIRIYEQPARGEIRVLFEGGSFLSEMTHIYVENGIFSELTHLHYYMEEYRHRRNAGWSKVAEPLKRLDWANDILRSDVVLYEVNLPKISEDFADWGNGFLADLQLVLENKTGPTKH